MLKFVFTPLFLIMIAHLTAKSQPVIPLYEGKIPHSIPCSAVEKSSIGSDKVLTVVNITHPTLSIYLPPLGGKPRTAVLICPGGGYAFVSAGHEGSEVAEAFNKLGIAAFVLRYRLPDDACMTDKKEVPLMDAQQAIYLIRKHAAQWNIDTSKLGVMGFSAGGHVASSLGTHFNEAVLPGLKDADLRPDFMMLIYPVISMQDSIAHMGSRDNLLGKDPDSASIREFSGEEQVSAATPPTFLVQASDDEVVNPQNSIVFYEALLKNHVPAELHLYEKGGHGFGLHNPTTRDRWFDRCIHWMQANQWL